MGWHYLQRGSDYCSFHPFSFSSFSFFSLLGWADPVPLLVPERCHMASGLVCDLILNLALVQPQCNHIFDPQLTLGSKLCSVYQQIANPQILGLIRLLQSHKFLRCASPLKNLKSATFFYLSMCLCRKFANFYKNSP